MRRQQQRSASNARMQALQRCLPTGMLSSCGRISMSLQLMNWHHQASHSQLHQLAPV